jgi:hypothetical protein
MPEQSKSPFAQMLACADMTAGNLQTRCLRLQAERDQLESQTGVTPERCRIERVNLQAKAKK